MFKNRFIVLTQLRNKIIMYYSSILLFRQNRPFRLPPAVSTTIIIIIYYHTSIFHTKFKFLDFGNPSF